MKCSDCFYFDCNIVNKSVWITNHKAGEYFIAVMLWLIVINYAIVQSVKFIKVSIVQVFVTLKIITLISDKAPSNKSGGSAGTKLIYCCSNFLF